MKDALSARQVAAFSAVALSAPAVTVCAGLPWSWTLALAALAVCVEVGLWLLLEERHLPRLILEAWGRPVGTALLVGTATVAVLVLWRLVPLSAKALPDVAARPVVPLVLLCVAAISVWHGRAAVIRAGCVLFFFVAALYGVVFFSALPDVQVQRLGAWQETDLLPAAILFLPLWSLYLPRRGSPKFGWAALFVLFPAAVAGVCAAVPGSRGSFYEMAKSVEVLSVAQRLEPLVSCLMTVGWFAAISLPVLAVSELADALGLPPRWAAVGTFLLAAPSCVLDVGLSDGILVVLCAVFCVVLPLSTPRIVARKKE